MDKLFVSDGCSVIGPIVRAFGYHNERIRSCCYKHDQAYWEGGLLFKKRVADQKFRHCLIRLADVPCIIAWIMWLGVAIGGFIPHPNFRWGYGWNWPRYKE